MNDDLPREIHAFKWAHEGGTWSAHQRADGCVYLRKDIHDAEIARLMDTIIKADNERDAAIAERDRYKAALDERLGNPVPLTEWEQMVAEVQTLRAALARHEVIIASPTGTAPTVAHESLRTLEVQDK